ncbi:MAG: histidine phosphatase family protein [bacterium]|nr:histidine phosphatase family protein [bacterium]
MSVEVAAAADTAGAGGTPVSSPLVTRLLLLRHAESEWNAQGRWQGQADTPLTDRGRRHAAQAGPLLGGFEILVCSDLRRARQSAEIIAAGAGIASIDVEPRLRERNAGPWQGLTRAEIERDWPGYLAGGRRPADYETDEQLAARADAALRRVASVADSRGASEVLVITHGGVIHSLTVRAGLNMAPMPNLSGRWVTVAHGAVEVGEPATVGDADRHSSEAVEALSPPI